MFFRIPANTFVFRVWEYRKFKDHTLGSSLQRIPTLLWFNGKTLWMRTKRITNYFCFPSFISPRIWYDCHYCKHTFCDLDCLAMGLLPNTSNCGCACAGNAGNVFPATAGKQSRHASRHVRDARVVMHAGIANSCFPLNSAAGGNVPGIPGACATRDFTYLVRGPYIWNWHRVFRGAPAAILNLHDRMSTSLREMS